MAAESNDREKEEKEALNIGLAAQGGACYILQEKTLLTTLSFALIKSCIYTGDCRNKCLEVNNLNYFCTLYIAINYSLSFEFKRSIYGK